MNFNKTAIVLALSVLFSFSLAQADESQDGSKNDQKRETLKVDRQNINTSCAPDAKIAGCAGEVVGQGLLICLHNYKKANPTFKLSFDCKEAMMKKHVDKKQMEKSGK